MGQGTESCGGYDVEYDPYWDEMHNSSEPLWTGKHGEQYRLSDMTKSHLRGAIRVAERAAYNSNFTCDQDNWNEWVYILESELESRSTSTKSCTSSPKKPVRGKKTKMKCHCGTEYEAREADLKRGYGLSCNKSCAAIRRKYNKPAAQRVDKS